MPNARLAALESDVDLVFVNARWFASEITKKGLSTARIKDLEHTRAIQSSAVGKRRHDLTAIKSREGAGFSSDDGVLYRRLEKKLNDARMWLMIQPRQVVVQPRGAGPWRPGDETRNTVPPPISGPPGSGRVRSRVATTPGIGRKTLPGLGPLRDFKPKSREAEALAEAIDQLDGADGAPTGSTSFGPASFGLGSAAEFETGWDLAIKRSQPRAAVNPAHAPEARQRIRAAASPAFAAALDRAVDAKLLTQFAAKHPGGINAAKLRHTYVEAAVQRFAGEFVKLVGGAPPASAQDIALGAIIAVAIAETSARFPIIPPAAVAPMAVMVHRTLRPQLQALARMAAVVAASAKASPARPAGVNQPAREMAW